MPNTTSSSEGKRNQKLVKRDELYRLLARHLPDTALFLLDHNLRVIVAEGQALTANNYDPANLEGRPIQDVLSSTSGGLLEQYQESLSTGLELVQEYDWPAGNYQIHTIPVRNQRGKITYLMVVANDITRQVASEQTLVAAEKRNRALLSALPDAMFVMNRIGIITEMHVHKELSFVFDENSVGKPLQELNISIIAAQKMMSALNDAFRSGHVQTYEYPLRQDGREIFFEGRTLAVNDDTAITVMRDITQLKLTARSLSERNHDLEILRAFDQDLNKVLSVSYVLERCTEYLIATTSATCAVVYLIQNDQFELAHARGVATTASNDIATIYQNVLQTIHEKRQPVQFNRGEHGAQFHVSSSTTLLAMPIIVVDELIGAVILESVTRFVPRQLVNIEQMMARIATGLQNARLYELVENQLVEMRHLYGKVRRLEQIKTDMIRMASHDLKNPLTGMRGYLQLLRNDCADTLSSEHKAYLSEVSLAADRMLEMINGILSLDRIQQLAENTLQEQINLRQLAGRVVHEHLSSARRKGIRLLFDLMKISDTMVSGDVFQIQEAITNLLTNAIKYTPEGGTVTVEVHGEGSEAILTVTDNGMGIPAGMQDKLFTAFYRAMTPKTSDIEGTGLGLHLVKNIVERHQGRVFFQSEYGKGSVFGFALPLRTMDTP